MKKFFALGLAILLGACGPKMDASATFGRVLTITNKDTSAFTIQKVVVNGNEDSSSCTDTPNKILQPGESYTSTYLICGEVASVSVRTDQGNTNMNLSWKK